MEAVSRIIAACSGPMACGGKVRLDSVRNAELASWIALQACTVLRVILV